MFSYLSENKLISENHSGFTLPVSSIVILVSTNNLPLLMKYFPALVIISKLL